MTEAIKIEIDKVSLHFIWTIALLELITVPMVVIAPEIIGLGFKNPIHGIFVGFIGVTVLLYFVNKILARLNIYLGKYRIRGVGILPFALWSGLVLAFIFGIQQILKTINFLDYPSKEIVLGFFSAGGAVLIFGLIYRPVVRVLQFLSIRLVTEDSFLYIVTFPLLRISLLAGIYEAVALPIILIWRFYSIHQIIVSAITGAAGGFAGGLMIWLISFFCSSSISWIIVIKKQLTGKTISIH
jgi:hypothetical protein